MSRADVSRRADLAQRRDAEATAQSLRQSLRQSLGKPGHELLAVACCLLDEHNFAASRPNSAPKRCRTTTRASKSAVMILRRGLGGTRLHDALDRGSARFQRWIGVASQGGTQATEHPRNLRCSQAQDDSAERHSGHQRKSAPRATVAAPNTFCKNCGSSPNSVGSELNSEVGAGCTVAAGSQGQARFAHRSADAARPWTALHHRAAWPLGLPAAQSVPWWTAAATC